MKNIFKKIIAVFIVAVMAVVYVPLIDIDNGFSIEASALTTSGSVSNMKWKYDTSNKTLTITGSGIMSNSSSTPSTFTKYNAIAVGKICNKATKIVISNGITSIGNYTFSGFSNVTSVTIPASVTSIGEGAFKNCTSLSSVSIPASVTSIGKSAFEGCSKLSSVTLNNGLTTIGATAFKNTKYANVSLPSTVTSIGTSAFAGISNLVFNCNYGDFVYNYCKTNSYKFRFKTPGSVLVIESDLNAKDKTVNVILKVVSDSTAVSAVNAGNFTFTYNSSVIPVSTQAVYDTSVAGVNKAIIYSGNNKVSIAVMAENAASYEKSGYATTYKIAEIKFKVNGQADTAKLTLTADALMLNGSKNSAKAADVSINLHKYDNVTITKAATCSKKGSMYYKCSICSKNVTEEIPLNSSNHVGGTETINVLKANCGSAGYTGDLRCLGCSKVIKKGSDIAATGKHSYSSVVTTAATCSAEGVCTYTCSVCNDQYSETIKKDASNHTGDMELRNVSEATCGADGYTGDTYCTACGELAKAGQVIAATGEHQKEIRDAITATCISDGYTGDIYCTVCGEKVTDGTVVKATGEHQKEIRDAITATCISDGYTGDTYCTVCGEKVADGTVAEATGHVTEVRDAVAATCLDDGYTGDTYCTVCGEKIAEGSVIAATGEHKTEVKNAVTASCAADGYTGDTYCTLCGEKLAEGEVIAATGEHDNIYTVITAADCTTEGEAEYTCSVCGNSGIETTEPVEHSYVAVVVDPTCVTSGYTVYTCSVCENSYRGDDVSSLGHDYDENGKCTRCDDVKVTEIVIIQNDFIEVKNINVNTNGGSETPDNAGDSENTAIKVIVSKKSSMSAADFLSYVEGENWSITDSEGNAVDVNSFVGTDFSISNAGGVEYKIVIFGDTNFDGNVTAADARLALRKSAKVEDFSDVQSLAADVDSSEVVNASDARVILRVSAKIETF